MARQGGAEFAERDSSRLRPEATARQGGGVNSARAMKPSPGTNSHHVGPEEVGMGIGEVFSIQKKVFSGEDSPIVNRSRRPLSSADFRRSSGQTPGV